jgi:D-aminoacyl-tRNA deacylase
LYTAKGLHLDLDLIDKEIAGHIVAEVQDLLPSGRYPLDLLVFLSKHRSEKLVDSLTVHHPGNFGKALFGGRDNVLPPSAPREISAALRALYRTKKDAMIKDRATFEVTHHGPYLLSPSFFIEIGSEARRWEDRDLGRIIASSLLSWDMPIEGDERPVCIGVGGGHYAPRFTDVVIDGDHDIGHMVPDYALAACTDPVALFRLAVGSTPECTGVLLHRNATNEPILERLVEEAERTGLKVY